MESIARPDGQIRVLVVDDERSIADTLKTILSLHGFLVATAYSGRTAVEAARLWKPDVLLSDVAMPEMSGVDAAICIRAVHPACKILLFSGHTLSESGVSEPALRQLNIAAVLQKPLHPDELIERIRGVLAPIPSVEIDARQAS